MHLNSLTTKAESHNWMLFQCITQCFGTIQSKLVFCLYKNTKMVYLHSLRSLSSSPTVKNKIIKSFIELQHLTQCFRTIVSNLVACCHFLRLNHLNPLFSAFSRYPTSQIQNPHCCVYFQCFSNGFCSVISQVIIC